MAKKSQHPLVAAVADGRVSRRAFMERALALGISASLAAAALSACTEEGDDVGSIEDAPKDNVAASGSAEVDAGAESMDEVDLAGTELRIYNWADYIAPDTIANFEAETGIEVIYETFSSSTEMAETLKSGKQYDILCPLTTTLRRLIGQGVLQKLDRSLLPNRKHISPFFWGRSFDPRDEYTVPWQWGLTGIAYRSDKLASPPDSWGVFLDSQYAGKMTMLLEKHDGIGVWLKYRGHSINSMELDKLGIAKDDAIVAKKNLHSYMSSAVKDLLISGEVWIAHIWNGEATRAAKTEPNIQWLLPKEGGVIWADALTLMRGAPNPRGAHAFFNYVLRPDVAANISDYMGYGTPNATATSIQKSPMPLPSADDMARLEFKESLSEFEGVWDMLWKEIQSS